MYANAYIFFNGRCEEALEFYRRALGAEVESMTRFKDNPEPPPGGVPPIAANKIMHARLRIGDTLLLASDHQTRGQTGQGFAVSLSTADDAEAERMFKALSESGRVQTPLKRTFFSSSFGMVTDRFGVNWMVRVDR